MRKVFIEDLPKKKNGRVDWMKVSNKFVHFIYDDIEDDLEIVKCEEIIRSNRKRYILTIQYKDYELFEMNIDTFTKGSLGNLLKRNTPDFKIKIGETFQDNKRNLTIIDRKYIKNKKGWNRKYYKYHCNKCNFNCSEHYKNGEHKEEHWIEESNLLHHKKGCLSCKGDIVVENINSIVANKETQWMIPYFVGGYDEAKRYTYGSGSKIYPVCSDCGRIKDKSVCISTIYREHSIGCICGDGKSFCEKMMYNMLEQLHISFDTEYSPDWIGDKRYDFYISSMKLIIEMDGGLGHGKAIHGRSNKTSEETLNDDLYKDEKAIENGLEVIRIDCDYGNNDRFKFIQINIIKKLSDLFDLSNIDWNKVQIVASENLLIQSCELWNCGVKNIYDISNKLNTKVGYETVRSYLVKGNELGLCEFQVDASRKARQVEAFKNGISLGVFNSCHEIEVNSDKLFGIHLNRGGISNVALGLNKTHKGFTFKYVDYLK